MSALDTKKAYLRPVVGSLVLIVAIAIILFSGTSAITETNLARHLERFTDYVAQQAAAAGKEAAFTHGALDIKGWGFSKHATVDNVSLELTDKASPDAAKWSISAAKMLILPDPINADGLIFEFPGPVNVAANGQPKTAITFPSPLKYVYSENKHIIMHALHLPSQVTFTDVGDNGRTVISYDQNPLFYEKDTRDSNGRESAYEFHHVNLTAADGTQVTAAAVASRFNEALAKNDRLEGKYTLAVSDLIVHNRDKASKAYNLNVNLSSSRTPTTGATETAINEIILATDNFKVKVTGGISTASDDYFPSGNAIIDIDNVPQFLASELMPEQVRKAVADALQKITGQAPGMLAHATIPVKRDKNGTLYVGDTTFAALAAFVLADMMQAAAPTAAAPESPPAPAANAPSPGSSAPESKSDSGQHGKPAKSPM